ncbi:MAG: hypothetical protein ACRD03_12165 [Acidimicrobiales bacterium]
MNGPCRSATGIAALASVVALIVSAAGAGATPAPAVTGGGAGPLDSDRVQVQLTARGTGSSAKGRFNIVHHTPDGIFAHLAGDVDCLAVAGPTAVVTGTITEGFDDLGIDPIGERVSLVIHDEAVDRIDMDVAFVSGHEIRPCSAEPILTITIDHGNFQVRP